MKRFVTIWFCHLKTDWLSHRQPELRSKTVVLALPDHGRMLITAVNQLAAASGIHPGMVAADAKAIYPGLEVIPDDPVLAKKILVAFAKWCIRFSPHVAVDGEDGLILDATGCPHLWGGEGRYLETIQNKFSHFGYTIRVGMADTIGTAWAVTRYGENGSIILPNEQQQALLNLPGLALRPEPVVAELLEKLGLRNIGSFIAMPRRVLRRRFGGGFIQRLAQALGTEEEYSEPVIAIPPYLERLPCPDPIVNATGISIGLERLLHDLCRRLQKEQNGLRKAVLRCYRADGKQAEIAIGTHRASYNVAHLFKLFCLKIETIEPGPGIELFTLEASGVEPAIAQQENIWENECGVEDLRFAELIDRIATKTGEHTIHRYLPAEHYWPERSLRIANSLSEASQVPWSNGQLRPIHLLSTPQPIEVMAPIPDYPPMHFRYRNRLYRIRNADGPERIEREWWIENGLHRDYYRVEDEQGQRFWLFRSGYYNGPGKYQWFLHGYFA